MLTILFLFLISVHSKIHLAVSINGVPLINAPFIDTAKLQKLSWKIIGDENEHQLTQATFSIKDILNQTTSSTMSYILPQYQYKANTLHTINLSITLTDGQTINQSNQFRTTFLNTNDTWHHAKWIAGGTLLKRSLQDLPISKQVANATAYASGVGCFSIAMDGIKISTSYMDAGWHTLPTVRIPYRAFDVTSFFSSSTTSSTTPSTTPSTTISTTPPTPPPQELTVSLGMCKYGYQNSFCVGAHAATDVCKAFLMALHITYTDGSKSIIVTSTNDTKWFATTEANPIRYSHLYHGEQYDGRVASNNSTQWKPAVLAMFNTGEGTSNSVPASQTLGTPVLLSMPPLEITKQYIPISIKQIVSGNKWIFDMSNNMAGFAKVSLPRIAFIQNVPIVLKYGEVLNTDGSVNMDFCTKDGKSAAGKDCDCTSINCANQTDTFIPAPATAEEDEHARIEYIPSFTYHGYRYVQIEGLALSYVPTTKDLTGLFLHSDVKQSGNLKFPSSPILNQIQTSIVQTQLSNLHFHPTDCPQREKRGWTGDAQFTSRQASLNFDMRLLYSEWLQTMQDHDTAGCAINGNLPTFPQTNKDKCCYPSHKSFGCDYTGIPNKTFTNTQGSVADVVPFMYVGGWPGDPSWGAIATVLPYTVWKGGDDALVTEFYQLAKSNVDFFLREASKDGLIEFGYYGDWLSIETTNKPQVVSLTQIQAVSHLVEMAEHLQRMKDVSFYNTTLMTLKKMYHHKYWNSSTNSYQGNTQTSNLMPLVLNIPPPTERVMAANAFVANVIKAGNASESGLVGASFVLQALVVAGRGDIALSMAMREAEPSWGFMLKKGPGTIWETWNDQTNSHNHPMFTASIGPYLYSIVGLNPSTWKIPLYLKYLNENDVSKKNVVTNMVTMHLTPDVHAVSVLKSASGYVDTLCGEVQIAWKSDVERFDMNVSIPHNCGRARLELHVPTKLRMEKNVQLCVGDIVVGGLSEKGKTVNVFVSGGKSVVALTRCKLL